MTCGVRGSCCAWVLMAGLAGCTKPPEAERQLCLLPSQTPVTLVGLFFGRDIPGGGQVSEQDWADFAADAITPRFPDGFTTYDGSGQWRDPETRHIGRERTKIVQIAVQAGAPALADRIAAVTAAYRVRFRQEAVGVLTTPGCAAF